jgi:uncharacterized protein (DUF433 family)
MIVSDSSLHGGEPIIEGTATTVRAVAELWNQGMSAEEVTLHLPHLSLSAVFEALHYYLEHRDEIEHYIEANKIPADWSGRRFNPRTGKVQ